jgi:hypothetical protein
MIESQHRFPALWKACLVTVLAAMALGGLPLHGHALVDLQSAEEPLAATQVGDPDIAIAYIGEEAVLRIEVRNTGLETWKRDQVVLSNVEQPLNAETVQPLPMDTPPGQIATWEIRVRAPDRPGAFRSGWQLRQAGQTFGPTLMAYLIVLPEGASELEEKIREKIDEWEQQAEQQIDDLIDEITTLILAEVEGFFQRLIDNVCGNACGASALIVFGALLLWWRKS